jgi:hypothetical protein
MSAISNATEDAILKLVFNATTWANYAVDATASPEANIVVTLATADPGDTGTGSTNEISYTNYARVNVARTSGGWTVSGTTPTKAAPVATISFPAGGVGSSPTATHFATTKSGGGASANLWYGTVSPNIVCGNGITPQLTTSTAIELA